jgi:hypothetical protein
VAQDVVLLLLIAQLVAVEADVLEDIAQLADVGLFDGVQRLVDALAVAGGVALGVQGIEAGVSACRSSASRWCLKVRFACAERQSRRRRLNPSRRTPVSGADQGLRAGSPKSQDVEQAGRLQPTKQPILSHNVKDRVRRTPRNM